MQQHLNPETQICCPQCNHKFLASEQKLEQQALAQPEQARTFDRSAAFVKIRTDLASGLKALGKTWFNAIRITTNDDANVATPIAVTVHFKDGKTRVARAGVLQPNIDQFVKSAIADIARWADLVYGGSQVSAN